MVGAVGVDRAHAPEQHEAPEHGSPAIRHEPSVWHRPPLQFPLQQSVFELHTSLSARHAPERTQRMLPLTMRQAPEQQFPSLEHSSPIGLQPRPGLLQVRVAALQLLLQHCALTVHAPPCGWHAPAAHVSAPPAPGWQLVVQQSAPVRQVVPRLEQPVPLWQTSTPAASGSHRPEQHSLGAAQRTPGFEHTPAAVVHTPRLHTLLQHCALLAHAAPKAPSPVLTNVHARVPSSHSPVRQVAGSLGHTTLAPARQPVAASHVSAPLQNRPSSHSALFGA